MKHSLSLLLIANLCLVASVSWGQKRTKSGDDLVTSEKKAKNVIKPEEEVDAFDSGDEGIEKLVAEKEAQLSKVRQRQIENARSILRKNPLYRGKASLLFRIAEKEWDEAKYRYFLARKKYERKLEDFEKQLVKKAPKEPEADYSRALVEYKKLLKEFPNYKRIDEVMYYLGRGLITAGKKKEGASYMLRLTKEYPNSRFKTPAYLAVAEYYFDNDLLFAAKTNYNKVLDDQSSDLFPYATYKLGYVHFNLREYEDSIRAFQTVVKRSKVFKAKQIAMSDLAAGAGTGRIGISAAVFKQPPVVGDVVVRGCQKQTIRQVTKKPSGTDFELDFQDPWDEKATNGDVLDQGRSKISFTRQAYSGITMAYAEIDNGWELARDYFSGEMCNRFMRNRLETLARMYSKQDKNKLEITVYEYLIKTQKQGRKVPEYAEKITASYKKQEEAVAVEDTINRFLEYFDPKGSWYVVNEQYEEPRVRANQYREFQLDYLINTIHTKADEYFFKLKNMEKAEASYRKVADYYEKHLALFPKSKELYEKETALANIYFDTHKDWDKASSHFQKAVEINPKAKESPDSAYSIILAKECKMANKGLVKTCTQSAPTSRTKKKKRGRIQQKASVQYVKRTSDEFKPVTRAPLHEIQKEFLDAAGFFVDTYPKEKRVPQVSFLAAEIYIKNGHYSEGVKRLEVIMEHHAKHRYAGFAAATLFDANYRLRRWDQMERWGRYMLKRRNFQVLKKKKLLEVIAISINEYATELNKKGSDAIKSGNRSEGLAIKRKAASEMLRFVKEFPKHDKASIALYNAAAISEQAEKTEEAIDLYERVIKRYPKTQQATESHWVLGLLYQSQTEFQRAAGYFEKMASFPDVPQVADALYNAGSIRAALEQYPKAIKIFDTYVKKFPENKDSAKLLLKTADYQHKLGNLKKVMKVYDRYLKMYGKANPTMVPQIYLKRALIHQEMKKRNARKLASAALATSRKKYDKLTDEQKEEPIVRQTMAKVRFLQAEYVYDDFEAVKLKFPPIRTLKKGLVKKAEILKKSETMFFEVLDYKAWDVAAGALYRIGESYYLFAQSLFDLPMPKGLSEDEEFIYRAELDDTAAPLQEKAIEATKRALELAHKHHVYNEWSRKAAALLVKLSPELFPVLDDAVVNTEWPVAATFSTTFIADPGGTLEQIVVKPKPVPATVPGQQGQPSAPGAAGPQGAAEPAVPPAQSEGAKAGKEGK